MLLCFFQVIHAQEIQRFTVRDFDLRGKVKFCLVITTYGQERFEFNEAGFLTKAVTQYNDSDQDITYYRYSGDELVEKRMESYKDRELDAATSLVSLYTIDTVPQRRVLEKIISYDKAFLEQREYLFNDADSLVKIVTFHAEGIDETTLAYTSYKQEHTKSIFSNGVLEKAIRSSKEKNTNDSVKQVLTKTYMEGMPTEATEAVYNKEGKLLSKVFFGYDEIAQEFEAGETKSYHYNLKGVLQKIVVETDSTTSVETYIFQYDAHPAKNWVKQIIIPANTYITRSITYYPEAATQQP